MRLRSLAVVVLVTLLAAPACSRAGGGDEGFRLDLDGKARISSTKGDRTLEVGKHSLAAGDTVTMLDGDAVLGLPGDRSLWLRAGDGDASVVQVADKPEIIDGNIVVVAGSDGARFTAGDVDMRLAEGAARVQRGLGVTVAVYRGSAEVRSAGRALAGGLPALRQVSIAATGLLPRRPVPLIYDPSTTDPWDQRFLGDAIDLGKFLDGQAKGFTSQLGPRASVDATLLQRVLPPLAGERSVGSKLADSERSAGEALVGATIVVESDGGSFDERWDDVFAFRDAGARWGLVALDQQVKRDALTGRLRDALGRSPLLFTAGPIRPTGDDPSGATPPATPTAQPPSGGGTTTSTPPDGPTTPTPTVPPTTVPPTTVPPITIPPLTGADSPPAQSPSDPGESSPPDPIDEVVNDIVDLVDAVAGDGNEGGRGREGGRRERQATTAVARAAAGGTTTPGPTWHSPGFSR